MASRPLTTEQFAANDAYHLNLINMKVKIYIWEDNGNIYKCDNGMITPTSITGFSDLIDVVSKDFAKKYVELPDPCPSIPEGKIRESNKEGAKYSFMKYLWERSPNHKPKKAEKPKKAKRGKKNRGKR